MHPDDVTPTLLGGSGAAARLVEALPTPTLLIDAAGGLLAVSDSWRTHLTEARVPGEQLWLPGADLAESLTVSAGAFPEFADVANRLRDALTAPEPAVIELAVPFPEGVRWFIAATSRLTADGLLLVSLTDITARRAAEKQLAHQATHDVLTGLPNRAVLIERLRQIGSGGRGDDALGAAVFFLDLDDFKRVNDTHGHDAGDRVLREVALRLTTAVRVQDLVARLGGDEFVVVAPHLAGELEALAYADRLLRALAPEVLVDGQPVPARASIGIAVSRQGDVDSDALLRNADIAMLKAKAERSGHLVFDDVLHSARRQRTDAVHALRRAVEDGEVQAWFQPVVRLRDGVVVGAEACARWVRADGVHVPPHEFLPLAQRTGLIGPLGRAVMRAVGAALAGGPLRDLSGCSVRAAPMQVTNGLIVDEVTDVLSSTGLAPTRLTVEITEPAVLGDPDADRPHLQALAALGVRIALADIGTGFSSLSHLADLPVDVVKLDRSFVQRMTDDTRSREIARAVIGLGNALELSVVAEGVESVGQRETLHELGCPLALGPLYGPAVPAERFAALHLGVAAPGPRG